MLLALRNLTTHRLRSALTALAIALGVAMMLAAAALGQAASLSAQRLSQLNETDSLVQAGPAFNTLLFQAFLSLGGVIVLFTAGFVIANAFGMAVTARLKELGALRTLGMTRAQMLALVLLEVGMLGLAGALGGVPLGFGLAWLALQLTGMGVNVSLPGWALVGSPLMGALITLVSAFAPALQASRVSPLETLRTETQPARRVSRAARRIVVAIILLLIALGLYAFLARPDLLSALTVLLPAMVVLLTLVAMLMPALVGPVANLARPWLERWAGQTAGRLAADNLRRHPHRAALTAGAMTAGLTMMIAMSGLLTVLIKGGLFTLVTIAREDRLVSFDITDPAAFSAETSLQLMTEASVLEPELVARLQALADAGRIELGRMDMVPIPAQFTPTPGAPGVFMDPEVFLRRGSFDFSEGNVEDALSYFARGPAILILPITAQRLDVEVGDSVSIQTPAGPVEFTVAGVGANVWAMTAFSFADGQRYFGVSGPTFMSVFAREGQNKEAVLREVDDLAADYGRLALDFKTILSTFFRVGDQLLILLNALLLLTVLVAALGVVNTMMINVTERQREIGMLRAVGATQKQMRRMVVAEGATLGLFAVAAAVLVSLVIVVAYLLLVAPNGLQSLGLRLNWETFKNGLLPALPVMAQATLAALFFAPLIAGLAAYYPARQAAALDVMEATRSEQLSLQPSGLRRDEGADLDRALPRSLAWLLTRKSFEQQRTRTLLSIVAITLGATMTVAGDVLAKSIIGVVTRTEDLRAIGEGLWSQLDPMFKGIGAGIMLAAGFLIFNTFAMSITQRRQQIGALRSLGMTRGQVLRMVLTEALVIGGTGTLLGLVLGPLVGQGIIAFMRSLDNSVLNAFVPSRPSPLSFVLAALMGLGVTGLAALMPARQAMRLSPLVALKAPEIAGIERSPTRLGVVGPALCLLLFACLIVAPPAAWLKPPFDQIAAWLAAGLWMVGIALGLPALVGVTGSLLRPVLTRGLGATGRLMADNFQRGRGRVLLTLITLAISLTMIGALTGFMQFYLFEFFGPKLDALKQEGAWVASMMDIEAGLAGYADMESLRLPPEAIEALRAAAGDRANFIPFGFVIVPELSFMGDTYFSFILDPQALREAGPLFMTFKQGDWETALPILERGCGVLMTPAIAARNNVEAVGDAFTVTSRYGPVECTAAGIGSTLVGATILSEAAKDSFDQGDPFTLFIQGRPGADRAQLEADLQAAADQRGLHMIRMSRFTETMLSVFDNVPVLFNAFLLMAVFAAALGVVNTTLLSVTERRREFGQLRALGATRAQVRAVMVGEAALMGLLGGAVGLVASVGLTVIYATVYGGSSIGVEAYQPWAAAFRTLPKVLPTGIMGVLASPLLCALAAYWPANAILRGAAIETLQPEQPQPVTRRQIAGLLSRGSIQTRFVVGTAALLLLVLAGLIQFVTTHARAYLEGQFHDWSRAMVNWNAAVIELALPSGAQSLDLSALQTGQQFNAEALLRFRSLVDEMSAGGLQEFVIADRDNTVLFAFDQRQIGATLPPLASADETQVATVQTEGERAPSVVASAPIRNQNGDVVGSVRLSVRATELTDFIVRLRNALWTVGGLIIGVGVLLSWVLSAPLARTARTLAGRAARVRQGDYAPIAQPRQRADVSIRTRLTVMMTLLVAALVGGISLIVIPLEREQIERTIRNAMLTSAEWVGQAVSENLPTELPEAGAFDPAQALALMQNFDLGQVQELLEQTRGDTIAYLNFVNTDGEVIFSDKVAQQGERAPTASQPQITDGVWREESIWIVSVPLRQGRDGEQIGTLGLGVRRAGIEAFLDESRNLFWLIGLIAVLAGLLLAQALGGAVAAPTEALASGARRVAQGDLSVKFEARPTGDELSQLAFAFNEMMAGLKERERLRDLFGRYLSREVGEAVLAGRVTLAGERRTITCLYVDMRGSTAFAEKHTPETVMAALNEYFEVIILAVEAHGGIVNRFVGDEVVCLFGAPTDYADHAERAVNAALAIREGLAYLNEKRAVARSPTLKFGLGLNTGAVVAGATGSEERQEYTVIGDAMNVGARIQALTKTFPEHDILLSEFTAAALREKASAYTLADLGEAEIRGKAQPLRLFGLLGRAR